MNGSKKQIRWANDIKAKFNNKMADRFAEIQKLYNKASAEKQAIGKPIIEATHKAVEKINTQTDAKFWIDNRLNLNKHFVEKVRKGIVKL